MAEGVEAVQLAGRMDVLAAPRPVGRYVPVALLGEGGMARVYLTVVTGHHGFRKLLVVKELKPALAMDADFVKMFADEARVAARLNHPNVVQTYEVDEDQGRHFIAMEYLEGQSLHAVLARVGREAFPLTVHVRILADLAAGVHYAHELRDFDGQPFHLVHRDISPQNVFVTYDGHVKLMDFGIAKTTLSMAETEAGTTKGKLAYMAPEQALAGKVDRRADVFALGVMLWEAIAGRRISAGETLAVVLQRRCSGAETRLRDVSPNAPAPLVEICERAMALERDERYATASDFQDALELFLEATERRTGAREVGTMISAAFAEDRASLRASIEELTKRLDSLAEGERAPLVDISTGAPVPRSDPALETKTHTAILAPVSPPPPARRKLVWVASLVPAILVVVVVVRVLGIGRPAADPAMASSAAPQRPAVTASAPLVAPSAVVAKQVSVEVNVNPANAEMLLDGVRLPSNPYRATVAADATEHKLRVSAAGYVSDERTLRFDRDVQSTIALSKRSSEEAVLGRPQPPITIAPVQASTVAPTATASAPKQRRDVDDSDPYSK